MIADYVGWIFYQVMDERFVKRKERKIKAHIWTIVSMSYYDRDTKQKKENKGRWPDEQCEEVDSCVSNDVL